MGNPSQKNSNHMDVRGKIMEWIISINIHSQSVQKSNCCPRQNPLPPLLESGGTKYIVAVTNSSGKHNSNKDVIHSYCIHP
jgi:hypothetical protein